MDALHNLNECFCDIFSHSQRSFLLLTASTSQRTLEEKNRALICMQISMYPISASFSTVFFIIIRMGQWLKENYNLHVASTKRLLKGNKFLRFYRFLHSHWLPMWFMFIIKNSSSCMIFWYINIIKNYIECFMTYFIEKADILDYFD